MQKEQWEEAYGRKDNFLFYPHEEVIRFASRHIRKRVGLDQFRDLVSFQPPPRLLDLGCGIGRHVIYAHHLGMDPYGIDLSKVAIDFARGWAAKEGLSAVEDRLREGSVAELPWPGGFFRFVVSHGVLDSMTFSIARSAALETARVCASGALFYCDLISGDDGRPEVLRE